METYLLQRTVNSLECGHFDTNESINMNLSANVYIDSYHVFDVDKFDILSIQNTSLRRNRSTTSPRTLYYKLLCVLLLIFQICIMYFRSMGVGYNSYCSSFRIPVPGYANASFPEIEDNSIDPAILSNEISLIDGVISSYILDDETFVNDISMVVLDSEGLAYKTDFLRNLKWVTRLTNDLLTIKKPIRRNEQFCALKDIARSDDKKRVQGYNLFSNRQGEDDSFYCHLVPGYDGYVYYIDEHGNNKLLQVHVKDIVNFTPFYTPLLKGVYLEGSRNSSVLALDYETGDYITQQIDYNSDKGGNILKYFVKTNERKQLHIGYTDWAVKAISEKNHREVWSFSWREIGTVNNDSHKDSILKKIKRMVNVENNVLSFNIPNRDKSGANSELQFPFPIAAVFAIFESKPDLYTLELLHRIPIPPPPSFLHEYLPNIYPPMRIKKSSKIKSLSIDDAVIKVADSMASKGVVMRIMNETGVIDNEYLNRRQIGTTIFLLKWWWLLLLWMLAIVLTPLAWVYRRVRKGVQNIQKVDDHKANVIESSSDSISLVESRGVIFDDLTSIDNYSDFNVSVDREITTQLRRAKSEGNVFGASEESCPESVWIEEKSLVNVFGVAEDEREVNGKESNSVKDSLLSIIPSNSILSKFLENGRFLRTFECIKLLGKGGFGSVYRAKHRLEPGNPIYAVKFVLLRLKASEDLSSRRYFREVAANRDIYSKYVVRYYTWWCEEPHFLPLAQMTKELQTAAANNVRHLIDARAIKTNKSQVLDDYLQKYRDVVCQYIQNPSIDGIPSFSKITHENKKRSFFSNIFNRREKPRPDQNNIPFQRKRTHSFSNESYPNPSDASHIVFKNTNETLSIDKSGFEKNNSAKEQEQQFPVVLLILMEMCNGFTLREWLNRPTRSDKPLDYKLGDNGRPIVFTLFKQLVKGLRDIHLNCFIHRDLKPENIFVDPQNNSLKIGDLGLVGFIEDTRSDITVTSNTKAHLLSDSTQVSVRGQVIGTPGYAAPEGGGNCTEKADIYSAALILLELLCPRFNTVMERLKTLEDFRNDHTAPDFIREKLRPWYDLMVDMANPVPELRPSALDIHTKLKLIIK